MDIIWGVDLADLQLISKFKEEFWFLQCVIDILINAHGLFLSKIKNALQ